MQPELRVGLRQLLHGDDDSIVLTTDLHDEILRIIKLQRQARWLRFLWRFHGDSTLRPDSRIFQRILNVIEEDVKAFSGMRRSEVVGLLMQERAVNITAD